MVHYLPHDVFGAFHGPDPVPVTPCQITEPFSSACRLRVSFSTRSVVMMPFPVACAHDGPAVLWWRGQLFCVFKEADVSLSGLSRSRKRSVLLKR